MRVVLKSPHETELIIQLDSKELAKEWLEAFKTGIRAAAGEEEVPVGACDVEGGEQDAADHGSNDGDNNNDAGRDVAGP